MKTDRISIFYKGVCVGLATNISSDMWHMEGVWARSQVALTEEFEQAAEQLELATVTRNYKKGIVVRCRDESEDVFMAVVTGLHGDVLGLMRFSSGEGRRWAEQIYAAVSATE